MVLRFLWLFRFMSRSVAAYALHTILADCLPSGFCALVSGFFWVGHFFRFIATLPNFPDPALSSCFVLRMTSTPGLVAVRS